MEMKALQPAWYNPKFNVSSKIVLGEWKIMVTIVRDRQKISMQLVPEWRVGASVYLVKF
jgi:hypothetical protein